MRVIWIIAGMLALGGLPGALFAERTTSGLVVLYDFGTPDGNVVKDRSGAGEPVDLVISEPQNVRRSEGSLEIRGQTILRSGKPARRLAGVLKRSGEITVEVWVAPADAKQEGPARIVTLSQNSGARNFTLGQEGDKFDFRLRSTKTSTNGMPSLSTEARTLHPKLTHVVYTRGRSGQARLYLDGRQAAETKVEGDFANWDSGYQLALGDEFDGGRLWHGTYHLVAIYSRDLTAQEVAAHFAAGPGADAGGVARTPRDPKAVHFETKIAPLLANHCLECHDPASREGKLDLTRRETAFIAFKHGQAVVRGKPDESVLWEAVYHDDMPEEGEPLSKEQKDDLRKWIEDGAVWTLDRIDPANYVHSSGGGDGERWVQRLTVEEYIATVQATVGVDIASEARQLLPPDLRADGFTNTAYNLSVDLKHVDAYAQLAEIIVSRMNPGEFAAQFSKSRRFTDDDMEDLIRPMGAWILRGPITERELITYRGISTSVAAAGGTFEEAVGFIAQAMLQSPRFIYRIENQRGDGTAWPVDDYELASRLSYIIWGASPDRELLRAAREGELGDPERLAAQAKRMLEDPRAIDRSLQFATQWLNLGRLANMQPNPEKFPNWDPQLAEDMRRETLAYFREVVWEQRRPLADLLNAQFTFLTPRLAAHYRGEFRRGQERGSQDLARVDLASDPARGGILTHGSVLTMGGDDASMVTRGLFVMHHLLRGVVKDPPPDVNTTPVPARPGLSHRGAAEQRIADRSCGGCHGKFEPLAFGLEKYDGLGSFHVMDRHGNTLREDGEVLIPGEAEPRPFQTAAELMNLLGESERVREALTWKAVQFSLGRPLGAADAPLVQEIHQNAQKNGGTWQSLLTALVSSDLVRMTRTEEVP